jgi:hypothetical protein
VSGTARTDHSAGAGALEALASGDAVGADTEGGVEAASFGPAGSAFVLGAAREAPQATAVSERVIARALRTLGTLRTLGKWPRLRAAAVGRARLGAPHHASARMCEGRVSIIHVA